MGYLPYSCGATRLTTSGVVGDSGKPILVCGYGVECGTVASPFLASGTGTNAQAIRLGPNTANQGSINMFGLPVMFPNGCYASFVTNVNAITVFWILQPVTN